MPKSGSRPTTRSISSSDDMGDTIKSQLSAMQKQIAELGKNLSAKHDDSITKIREHVDTKVAELGLSINAVVEENAALKGEVASLKDEVDTIKADLSSQRMQTTALQKDAHVNSFSMKGCNLVIYGMTEAANECGFQAVQAFLKDKIKVPNCDDILFKDAFRMGNPKKRRVHPRPMKVQLVCMPHKRAIMDCYLAKRDDFIREGYRLRDDLPLHARIFRKDAYPFFAKIKDAGYTPSFRLDTVRVKQNGAADNAVTTFNDVRDLEDFCNTLPAGGE